MLRCHTSHARKLKGKWLLFALLLCVPPCAIAQSPAARHALRGLIDMGDIAFHNFDDGVPQQTTTDPTAELARYPGSFGGLVLNVTWAQLQPTQQTVVSRGNVIDTALAHFRAYNMKHPQSPLLVRLRVWPGINAPAWAKQIGGPAIKIRRNSGANRGLVNVGRYWSPQYSAAWQRLQQQLAALYDSDPLIASVTMASCAAQTTEPIVPTGDPESLRNLYAAGLNDAAMRSCLTHALDDYSAWKQTPIDWAFNPYSDKDATQQTPPGDIKPDPAFTTSLMAGCRSRLGDRCILTQMAINCPVEPKLSYIYDGMRKLGGPVSLETQAPSRISGSWDAVVRQSIAFGAQSVELWTERTGFTTKSPAEIARLAAWFATPGGGQTCPSQ
jgi:hypothetical protein